MKDYILRLTLNDGKIITTEHCGTVDGIEEYYFTNQNSEGIVSKIEYFEINN